MIYFTLKEYVMKREGNIKISSENMMPIIKKWLYSDKDIFLRESTLLPNIASL